MGPSLSTFEKLWAKNPTSILFARLADAYRLQGDLERALEVCRRGLRYRPSYATGHMVMGRCCQDAGLPEEARQEYEKVIRLDPDHVAAHWELGRLERGMGLEAQALRRFRRALAVDPLSTTLSQAVEELSRLVGEGQDVDAEIDGAGDPEWESLAPETESVSIQSEPAAALDPKNIPEVGTAGSATDGVTATGNRTAGVISMTLADLYASQGFVDKAVEVMEALIKQTPGVSRYRDRLRELKSGTGA